MRLESGAGLRAVDREMFYTPRGERRGGRRGAREPSPTQTQRDGVQGPIGARRGGAGAHRSPRAMVETRARGLSE